MDHYTHHRILVITNESLTIERALSDFDVKINRTHYQTFIDDFNFAKRQNRLNDQLGESDFEIFKQHQIRLIEPYAGKITDEGYYITCNPDGHYTNYRVLTSLATYKFWLQCTPESNILTYDFVNNLDKNWKKLSSLAALVDYNRLWITPIDAQYRGKKTFIIKPSHFENVISNYLTHNLEKWVQPRLNIVDIW